MLKALLWLARIDQIESLASLLQPASKPSHPLSSLRTEGGSASACWSCLTTTQSMLSKANLLNFNALNVSKTHACA